MYVQSGDRERRNGEHWKRGRKEGGEGGRKEGGKEDKRKEEKRTRRGDVEGKWGGRGLLAHSSSPIHWLQHGF